MKKLSIFALIVVLAVAMAACGKKNDTGSQNTTVPTTGNSILPEMDPTMDTNIPDDNVNGNSTDTTGTTNATENSGSSNGGNSGNGSTSGNSTGVTGPDGTMK